MPHDPDLLAIAKKARGNAHAPYSRFFVGAALRDDQGQAHKGCNVENAAYPEGMCAEATAIGAMVTSGGKRITEIAIVGGHADGGLENCTPCGGCRQKILEFSDEKTRIILEDGDGRITEYTIADLLPASFRL